MLHETVLRQLMPPIELGGDQDLDLKVEGSALDRLADSAAQLLREMYPDTCLLALVDWERVYGLTPGADDPVTLRRARLVSKIQSTGGLSREYFIQLAAALGYTITITEFVPFMAGWSRAGDRLYVADAAFCWQVSVSTKPFYAFRAGQSCAGDPLGYTPDSSTIEGLFNELKPAHTAVVFKYL